MATYASGKTSKAELLKKAKSCWKRATEAEKEQRKREKEDLRFQVPEFQWDEAAKAQRQGGTISGGIVTPPRPMLSISKIDHPIQLIYNQFVAADLGVNIHPVSEDATKDTAEVFQGLYRRIEVDSNANQARAWAFDRAVKCGRGAYLVTTDFDEDADPTTGDQEIRIERILDQSQVYFDPAAIKPDFSDGEWAFMAVWMDRETFRRTYPDAMGAEDSSDSMAWASLVSEEPDWVRSDEDDKQAVLVCNYWYKKHNPVTVKYGKKSRVRDEVVVCLAKITGFEVLEDEETDGQYIPLIPVIGRELQPFDSERRWIGMIGPSKDGQRLYNFAASTLVERMALEPKTPFIGGEGQFEGHEAEWQQANVRNLPYLEYKPTAVDGKPLPPPQRAQLDQSGMSLAMMALQEADNFIQATTAMYDPALGRLSQKERSGKAILASQSQSDAGTSHYAETFRRVSFPYEIRVILDLIPKIYDRPGRATKIVWGEKSESKPVMLNAPYVPGPDGEPQAVAPGMPVPPEAKEYNLREGRYSFTTSIGKSFQSRLQAGAEQIGQVLAAWPEGMPIIGDLLFEYQDMPGSKKIAERLAKWREATMPGLTEQGDGGPTKEQATAKAQALEQQLQQMQQQMQEMRQFIDTEQAKQQGQIEKARMDNEAKVAIAQAQQAGKSADNETALAIQNLKNQLEEWQTKFEAAHEVAMAAAGAHTMSMKHEAGENTDEERGEETSEGQNRSNEQSQERKPPTAGERE